MSKYDMIHIGFEKYDFNKNRWRIQGIDDELKNGEVQKIFGTIIYVVRDLYNGPVYNNILMWTEETKKFRVYLRLASQISNKLIPGSSVSHNEKTITITKKYIQMLIFQILKIKQNINQRNRLLKSISTLQNKINISLYIIIL